MYYHVTSHHPWTLIQFHDSFNFKTSFHFFTWTYPWYPNRKLNWSACVGVECHILWITLLPKARHPVHLQRIWVLYLPKPMATASHYTVPGSCFLGRAWRWGQFFFFQFHPYVKLKPWPPGRQATMPATTLYCRSSPIMVMIQTLNYSPRRDAKEWVTRLGPIIYCIAYNTMDQTNYLSLNVWYQLDILQSGMFIWSVPG